QAQHFVRALAAATSLSNWVLSGDVPAAFFTWPLSRLVASLPAPSNATQVGAIAEGLEHLADFMPQEQGRYLLSCAARLRTVDLTDPISVSSVRNLVMQDLQDLSSGLPVRPEAT